MNKAFADHGKIVVHAGYGLSGAADESATKQISNSINTNVVSSIPVWCDQPFPISAWPWPRHLAETAGSR